MLGLVWHTALDGASEVEHHIALVEVQAERALPHREPLGVIVLPVVPRGRRRQLHIPSHLPHQADYLLDPGRMGPRTLHTP